MGLPAEIEITVPSALVIDLGTPSGLPFRKDARRSIRPLRAVVIGTKCDRAATAKSRITAASARVQIMRLIVNRASTSASTSGISVSPGRGRLGGENGAGSSAR